VNFADAVAALDARTNYERSGVLRAPTIERMAALVDMLAHPERGMSVIHVTGTNGKSTVARAATEILRASGLKVATYTSPHVSDIRERIAFDGAPIGEGDFAEAWRELEPYLSHFDARGERISWFEAATALAFVWFADKAVDAAVIEVGMGGTWDATNVVDADVAVFTEVGLDHAVLGATPEEVAAEKAGIIKRTSIPVSVAQAPEVAAVLTARAHEVGAAPPRFEPAAFSLHEQTLALGGQVLTFRLAQDRYDSVLLPMFGAHAARDAVLGAAAARALLGDPRLDDDVVRAALGSLSLPGRMEVVGRHPLVVLDGAHNPAAARALAVAMSQSFRWEQLRLVVSVMADKDVRGVLEPLLLVADEVIVTGNNSLRAADPDDLAAVARALDHDPIVEPDPAEAVALAIERSGPEDAVLVTGSMYIVGDVRAGLLA
jgi:dihydrofolate synthase/folylpolyglutamate synthase